MSEHTPIDTDATPTDAATRVWDPVLFALYLRELEAEHGSRPN